MDIHIIRHGKTIANEQRLYCGHTDLPLSEAGISQIGDIEYPQNIDLFFTSGLLRTRQTIQCIYGPAHAQTIPQLAEFNFGQFEMKSYEDLKEQPDYQAWITDETGLVSCPGGENKQEFMKRVLAGYDILLEKSKQAQAVVLATHGGVIASIMDYLFPGVCNFYEWQPQPGHGYTLRYANGKLCNYEKI